ncbi:MAG: S9 family peptidase [Bacteroidia bacterium]|nr:S9 family peptidase [Bacteroidia bacterium]
MKIILTTSVLVITLINTSLAQYMQYPPTHKRAEEFVVAGNTLTDEYSWLENDNSTETKTWVETQNKVTENYMRKLDNRAAVKNRLQKLWNYEKLTAPTYKAGCEFYFKNNGMQNQSVLYMKGIDGKEKLVLDPNALAADGTASITTFGISKNAKYLAYALAKAGSDWTDIYTIDLSTMKTLSKVLNWTKFTSIAWRGDAGFYYCKYNAPKDNGKTFTEANEGHKIFYYNLKTPTTDGSLVYENTKAPKRTFGADITDDEKWVMIYESESTSGNALYLKSTSNSTLPLITISNNFDNDWSVIHNTPTTLYLSTNYKAPNKQVISFDIVTKKTKIVIADKGQLLEVVSGNKNTLLLSYLDNVKSQAYVYNYEGKQLQQLQMPEVCQLASANANEITGNYSMEINTFTAPTAIYNYDVKNNKLSATFIPKCNFNADEYVTEQIFVPVDGAKIPVFLVHKKGIELNGTNPCFLFGYGGFSSHYAPEFRVDRCVFLEQGGVYAVAGIRGGDEYGEEWHKAGIKLQKKNCFNDFIAVANYLCDNKYTNHESLAIHGRSNGGLLIGAVMTMEPTLAKVAIPTVGVLDMLKFHKFTIGYLWTSDYGCADNKEEYEYIKSYSPYHNLKNITYPATLITTGDHDDRVVPAHSFKFAARLQELNTSENPTLIRIDVNAGHGSGKPISKQIDEYTDIWSFVMHNLGMKFK